MFWKKKKQKASQENKIILAMVILPGENTFNTDAFSSEYKTRYGTVIKKTTGDHTTFGFEAQGESVVIAHMPVPIPAGDLQPTAQYAYNWPDAEAETRDHQSHLIVSMMQGGSNQVKRYRIFTEIICAILRTTDAIGIYQGGQSLLIAREQYLETAQYMDDNYLPIDLWIYFGLSKSESGNSGYTYGLKQFNKTEMEIVHSSEGLEDIRGLLFNLAAYVVENDITFRDGETCGFSAEQKIVISYSKGIFLEGNTFKLAY